MMRGRGGRLLAALLAAVWALAGCGTAEDAMIPVSAVVGLEMELLPTGGFAYTEFTDNGQYMSGAALDALYDAMGGYVAPEQSLLVNRSEYFYYYEQLDPDLRQIYDVLLQVAQDPVSPNNYGVLLTGLNPRDGTLARAFADAYTAMTFDHPELFWLYNFSEAGMRWYIEDEDYNGQYMVFFGMEAPFAEYEAQLTAFNRATDEFLADIDRSGSQYDVALRIHDKLADLVTYDTAGLGEDYELIHTAYAALVANDAGVPHAAVCDGYSLALEYLLQQCGIPAMLLGGKAGNRPFDLGGHAWCMARLDGTWYEIDITFEDSLVDTLARLDPSDQNYPAAREQLADAEYRGRLLHHLFLVSTATMEHFEPDDSWLYNGRRFIPDSYHLRQNDSPFIGLGYDARETVIALAPKAESAYAGR